MTQYCNWLDTNDKIYINYHDNEWGKAVHDDRLLFEMLVLEGFQAGLSWKCVLHKRDNFKEAFNNFDVLQISKYNQTKLDELYKNDKIIKNKLKIGAAITNSKIFLDIQSKYNSFDNYIWSFTKGKTIKSDGIETTNYLSDEISKDLKKRGMKFVGSTIIFSYLCAIGIIDAHQPQCHLFKE